ncbi:MAG: enoyl-CoA hydratase/isomerase family protein [Candidatus Helarchaeota archaeon]
MLASLKHMDQQKEKNGTLVLLERVQRIGILTLNRPDVLNCINLETMKQLNKAVLEIKEDKSLKVLILKGAGERAFSTGMDLNTPANAEETDKLQDLGRLTLYEISQLPQIVIASIQGYALGGGLELALAADFRIASDDSQFGFPEVKYFLLPFWGGLVLLPKIVGRSRAKELIHTGESISASWAKNIGLVHEVVPKDSLDLFVMEFAKEMSRRSGIMHKLANLAIDHGTELNLKDGFKLAKTIFDVFRSKEKEERYQDLFSKLNRSKLDL